MTGYKTNFKGHEKDTFYEKKGYTHEKVMIHNILKEINDAIQPDR